mmetsp:Transcript_22338/g.45077  ORF Transcript_22338/g.45077 Transcript_22338/m.45077 type:complete len:205 (-) Transcript_22338:43-657(-)
MPMPVPARTPGKVPHWRCATACAKAVRAAQRPKFCPETPSGCERAPARSAAPGGPAEARAVQPCRASACTSPARRTSAPAVRRALRRPCRTELPSTRAATTTQSAAEYRDRNRSLKSLDFRRRCAASRGHGAQSSTWPSASRNHATAPTMQPRTLQSLSLPRPPASRDSANDVSAMERPVVARIRALMPLNCFERRSVAAARNR